MEFLETEFLGNALSAYLMVLVSILTALALKRLISKYFASLLFKFFTRTGNKLNKLAFVGLLVQPLEIFLFLFISFVALDKLTYPLWLDFKIYRFTFFEVIDSAAITALVSTFTWLCLRTIDFFAMLLEEIAEKAQDNSETQHLIVFFKDFFKIIIGIIGFLLVLRFGFHKDIGNLVTGLSIVGAAIALATKESLENLIASFIIFFDRPFMVGETVKLNALTGTVEKIGLRSTRIRTEEKTYISVPNKQMVDSIVDNLSRRTYRKANIVLEIDLKTNASQLSALLKKIQMVLTSDGIEDGFVYLKDTGKHSHVIEVEFYTDPAPDIRSFFILKEKINLDIIAVLENMDLEFAAANKEVLLKEPHTEH